MVQKLNGMLSANMAQSSAKSIGLLDIFGFENFDCNRCVISHSPDAGSVGSDQYCMGERPYRAQ